MKKWFSLILAVCFVLCLFGCNTEPEIQKDVSGKYDLDVQRNEAIINDAGTVTVKDNGNARLFYHIRTSLCEVFSDFYIFRNIMFKFFPFY